MTKYAFPEIGCDEASLSNGGCYTTERGMTLRDYFAAKAMQAIISFAPYASDGGVSDAERAYQFADAMLKEREK